MQGYRQALESAGMAVDESLIWYGTLCLDEVAALCREKLCNANGRPEALFCTNGHNALGVLRAFRDCRIETPRDIGFVTFDELTVEDLFTPSITTIVQPAYDIGFRAGQILLDRIEGVATRGESDHGAAAGDVEGAGVESALYSYRRIVMPGHRPLFW